MKYTMRDKVCQLIGKYESKEDFHRKKVAKEFISRTTTCFGKAGASEDAVIAMCYIDFLADLKWLLDEGLEQPQLRTQMLEDARRDAQTFRQKYNTLEAIAPIITSIDAVFGEEDAPCATQ